MPPVRVCPEIPVIFGFTYVKAKLKASTAAPNTTVGDFRVSAVKRRDERGFSTNNGSNDKCRGLQSKRSQT